LPACAPYVRDTACDGGRRIVQGTPASQRGTSVFIIRISRSDCSAVFASCLSVGIRYATRTIAESAMMTTAASTMSTLPPISSTVARIRVVSRRRPLCQHLERRSDPGHPSTDIRQERPRAAAARAMELVDRLADCADRVAEHPRLCGTFADVRAHRIDIADRLGRLLHKIGQIVVDPPEESL